jgi:hypothetical protein
LPLGTSQPAEVKINRICKSFRGNAILLGNAGKGGFGGNANEITLSQKPLKSMKYPRFTAQSEKNNPFAVPPDFNPSGVVFECPCQINNPDAFVRSEARAINNPDGENLARKNNPSSC